ncbi:MAG: PEP/pyruvate-binding domain-containing protein [Actinomycetes bacterium]
MSSRLLSLDDAGATDPGAVGAKAAGLARARQAGLPVAPGYVVPVVEGQAAMQAGQEACARVGEAAGRRAALAVPVAPALAEQLQTVVDRLGGRVVVRSSSPLEDDHRWSGAFSSLSEIGPADAAVALRSCWASVFAVDPRERAERCGVDPAEYGLAVLVQPELVPTAGGVARVERDEVQVTGVDGHPGALLSGWVDGATARFGPTPATGTALAALVGEDTVARVVDIARAVSARLGDDVLEWASVGDETYVLQTSRTVTQAAPTTADPPASDRRASEALQQPCALDFARLLDRYSSDAARYVLPWAGGTAGVSGSAPDADLPSADLDALFRAAMRDAWDGDVTHERAAEDAVEQLAGSDPRTALARLASAAAVEERLASALLQALDARHAAQAQGAGSARPDARWSPFVASVVLAHGRRVAGTTCVPGGAVGRLWYARPHAPAPSGDGYVLVCARPLPALAPLLFGARAIVTLGGPADSHLAEVARSLGVPMLVGADVTRLTGPLDRLDESGGWLGAIDASRGELAAVARTGRYDLRAAHPRTGRALSAHPMH